MGRKTRPNTNKGKEKRQQRKEEAARIAVSQDIVNKANNQEDPLLAFPVFRKFDKNDLTVTLECKRSQNVDPAILDWAFQLLKENMQAYYEDCEWGWSDKEKREEMVDDMAWLLVAQRTSDDQPVAFSLFRFDLDYGDEVLYCYELQLCQDVRRKGLGKFMLQLLELLAFSVHMKKVILTVLKHNPEAVAFFTALNYKVDETSPEDNIVEQYHYQILSKMNKRLLASQINN
uniref:N-alpha-acetyltransferase 40 n=1 Tax=Timema genevievae TaxID=629358 RepID=A0A7R9JNG1_TIMGE|nr:unnamed protein product [Timema genevievae]